MDLVVLRYWTISALYCDTHYIAIGPKINSNQYPNLYPNPNPNLYPNPNPKPLIKCCRNIVREPIGILTTFKKYGQII